MKLLIFVLVCLLLAATTICAQMTFPDTCCCEDGRCLTKQCNVKDMGGQDPADAYCQDDVCHDDAAACNDLCCDSQTPEFTTIGVGLAVVIGGGVGYWLLRKNKK